MERKTAVIKRAAAFAMCIFLLFGSLGAQAAVADGNMADGYVMSNATAENGVLTVNASGGRIETPKYSMQKDMLVIRMKTSANGGGRVLRAASNVRNTTEMLKIDSETVQVFGSSASLSVADGLEHSITLALDFSVSPAKTAFWFDGELKNTGTYERAERIDRSAIYFTMANSGSEDWVIGDFFAADAETELSLTSVPANKAAIYAADAESIKLDFGTYMSPIMGYADNYVLSRSGETAQITVSSESGGAAAKITPNGGFSGMAEYTLRSVKTQDLFGTESDPIEISFTVVADDYSLPTISFKQNPEDMEIHTGEIVPLSVIPGELSSINRVEIFADGVREAVLDEVPFEYNFCRETPGEVQLKAVGYDAIGLMCSVSANITVLQNDPPQLEVEGIADGGIYNPETIASVTVRAYDSDGIDKIIFIADGKEIAQTSEETAEFSLKSLTGGTHTVTVCARDKFGAETSKSYVITLEGSEKILLTSHDFSSYAGGSEKPPGCWGDQQRGYIDSRVINPEFGKSLIIGMDTVNEAYAPDNAAYMGLGTTAVKNRGVIELDIYIDKKPGLRDLPDANGDYADSFKFTFKKNGAAESTLLSFTGEGIKTPNETIPYSEGKWYHLTIEADVENRAAAVTVTGDDLSRSFSLGIGSGQDEINYLRIYGPVFDDVKTFIAVDNVFVYERVELPTVTFMGEISAETSEIICETSAALETKDLTSDTVVLKDEAGGIVQLAEIRTEGNKIIMSLQSPLKSGTRYTLTISASVRYAGGSELGFAIKGEFMTAAGGFDIVGGVFEEGGFTVTAVNTTQHKVDAYVVLQVWNGIKIKKVLVSPLNIPAESGEAEYRVSAPIIQRGEKMTAYIFSDYKRPKTLTSKVFAVEK